MNDSDLLEKIDTIIRFMVKSDLPDLDIDKLEIVVGHLTGAVFVTVMEVINEEATP